MGCVGMERLLDCLVDFALRNGPGAALRVNRQRPSRGAILVHNLYTPTGYTWKPFRAFHTPSCREAEHQQNSP